MRAGGRCRMLRRSHQPVRIEDRRATDSASLSQGMGPLRAKTWSPSIHVDERARKELQTSFFIRSLDHSFESYVCSCSRRGSCTLLGAICLPLKRRPATDKTNHLGMYLRVVKSPHVRAGEWTKAHDSQTCSCFCPVRTDTC